MKTDLFCWALTKGHSGLSQLFTAIPNASIFSPIYRPNAPVYSTWANGTFQLVDNPGTYGAIMVQAGKPVVPASFSGLSASQFAAYGSAVTLSGSLSADGPVYPAMGETVTVTINGNAQATTINDATGDFSISYELSSIPASASPYTITYFYAGDSSLNPTTNASTTLTVNKATPTITTAPTASSINYGQTLASSTLSGGLGSVPGKFDFTTPTTAPGAGTAPQSVTFTPTDTTDYNTATGSVNVTVLYITLVTNGGFETGDFSGWTQSGNMKDTALVANNTNYAHSGTYGAQFGPGGTLGYLSQTIPTQPGVAYQLSLWLSSQGVGTNEFLVSWNGTNLFDLKNIGMAGWTNLQFQATATTINTVLQFGFRNDESYFGFDDISLIPVTNPKPAIRGFSLVGTNLVVNGLDGVQGGVYVVWMSTNLTLTAWMPVATNVLEAGGYFTLTATNAVNRQLPKVFYRLQKQ